MTAQATTEVSAPQKRTLDMIVTDYLAELYAGDGEVTISLEGLELEFEDKALAYQYAAKKLKAAMDAEKAQVKFFSDEAARHKRRCEAIDKSYDRLKTFLAEGMRRTGKIALQTILGKIYFRAFPVVKLNDDWARTYADRYPQYVRKVETVEPLKTELLKAFKGHLAEFQKAFPDTEAGRAAAWQAALEQMPQGFNVDPNEQLCGV